MAALLVRSAGRPAGQCIRSHGRGRGMSVRRWCWLVLAAALAPAGCSGEPQPLPEEADPAPPEPAGGRFDPATAGTLRGRVCWPGPAPAVAGFQFPRLL